MTDFKSLKPANTPASRLQKNVEERWRTNAELRELHRAMEAAAAAVDALVKSRRR